MKLARVTGSLFATRKNPHFEGRTLLLVQETTPQGEAVGNRFLAIDRVSAGIGDRVLVNAEGSSARLLLGDEDIPVQAVIVAIVDDLDLAPETAPEPAPDRPDTKS